MKFKLTNIAVSLLLLDFVLLILLGKTYTKYLILYPYFYLHDVLLIIIALLCLVGFNFKKNRIYSIETLSLIGILYLIFSFIIIDFDVNTSGYYIFRQFAIFGYLISFYIIIKRVFALKEAEDCFIKSIQFFGVVCFIIQLIYISNLILNTDVPIVNERNSYSPIIIMGFFVLTSFILTASFTNFFKFILLSLTIVVSYSIGHDSVYLGLIIIIATYFFIYSKKNIRIGIIVLSILIGVLVILYVPSFTDVNMQWRLIFWKDVISKIGDNYLILGDGFGAPYASNETIENLNNLMLNNGYSAQIFGDEKYLTAPHNSFLSMFLHIGVLSVLLLLYPFAKVFYSGVDLKNKKTMFLLLSLIGMVVFSFFNVILELPHSSSIFWVVYFVLIFKLNKESEKPTNTR